MEVEGNIARLEMHLARIEVPGFPRWHPLDEMRRARLELPGGALPELPPDDRIAARAIALRRQKKMSLADSILAATALLHRLPLVTRNEAERIRVTLYQMCAETRLLPDALGMWLRFSRRC